MHTKTRLIVVFTLCLIGLFALELLQPVQQFIILPFTALIAKISAWIVQIFDASVVAQGIIMRNIENGAAVSIQPGCNGVEAMICLIAAILAFPAPWVSKLWGLVIGSLAIQALNIVRIISLFYLLQWNYAVFEWAHLYLWQALIILDAFIVFIVWIHYLPAMEAAPSSSKAA